MDKEKLNYYKENPDVYIKEVLGVDLFPWQVYLLKEMIKNPKKYLSMLAVLNGK